eukprot:5409298-Amphidinium_carterae.2
MNREEPEPQPSSACDIALPRVEPCLVDSVLARQLTVRSPARAYVVWRLPGASRGEFYLSGLHIGEHSWEGLQQHLSEGHYLSGRDRLRRLHNAPGEDLVAAG